MSSRARIPPGAGCGRTKPRSSGICHGAPHHRRRCLARELRRGRPFDLAAGFFCFLFFFAADDFLADAAVVFFFFFFGAGVEAVSFFTFFFGVLFFIFFAEGVADRAFFFMQQHSREVRNTV